ncbi:class I SAM-dependent methyltransferase [Candidatus Roizmanbacteria bacterium]|nr:class I SAM-dependent methyltransferase [Candidatus Roizmanbacteria bacterium]
MSRYPNQKLFWEKHHKADTHKAYIDSPSRFAREVEELFPPGATVLELGCGVGADASYFAEQGNTITATDFSEAVIRQNQQRYSNRNNLAFQVLDISKPFPFSKHSYDVVYAHLSLHYFTDSVTRKIVNYIHTVLKPDGLFCFMCKSTDDPLYGKGIQIEKDMFEKEGHIRHFFSETYAKELFNKKFNIQLLESGKEDLYGYPSAYIQVVGRNI